MTDFRNCLEASVLLTSTSGLNPQSFLNKEAFYHCNENILKVYILGKWLLFFIILILTFAKNDTFQFQIHFRYISDTFTAQVIHFSSIPWVFCKQFWRKVFLLLSSLSFVTAWLRSPLLSLQTYFNSPDPNSAAWEIFLSFSSFLSCLICGSFPKI